MSRLESHDLPGFGQGRSTIDVDRMNLAYPSSSHSLTTSTDRRLSSGFTPYTANVAIPHYGMHSQDKEFSPFPQLNGWSAVSNRHSVSFSASQPQHFSSTNHHSPSPAAVSAAAPPTLHLANQSYHPPPDVEGDLPHIRQSIPSPCDHQSPVSGTPTPSSNPNFALLLSTLWWGDLEPWMDEEYAKQVCALMGWDPVNVKAPLGPSDASGQQANNPGYCFLTFPSPSIAASVLNQVSGNGGAQPVTMPNSSKPFVLNWASLIPSSITSALTTPEVVVSPTQQQYPKEYSIFVGDLAPETSNSDLVAVFRNPVLGLRNDREPKFIRPFLSCKSAKIMLDPVTGVSKGYGFVRFTDEADQQRALIEMHGLYCLSRPMRISPATAKFKPPQVSLELPLVPLPVNARSVDTRSNNMLVSIPLPNGKSVSSPMAVSGGGGSPSSTSAGTPVGPSGSGSSLNTSGSGSVPSLGSASSTSMSSGALTSASSDDMLSLAQNTQGGQQFGPAAKGNNISGISSITSGFAQDSHEATSPRYMVSAESWKHHAQARAILGNLIGPNGEQLTSTDPYNTTVFVGGLSPLISEETLRTFFAPFGDIHYVKVPVGKHCGFVQFVRKADAERAIEKMQGFPIGGSRIRLSWGRSQYKAAQAAAQAAQAASLQAQFQAQLQAQLASMQLSLSPDQALQLLQKLSVNGSNGASGPEAALGSQSDSGSNSVPEDKLRSFQVNQLRGETANSHTLYESYSAPFSVLSPETMDQHHAIRPHLHSSFSPFSPDPNAYMTNDRRRCSEDLLASKALSQMTSQYPPRFDAGLLEGKPNMSERPNGSSRVPKASGQYSAYFDHSSGSFEPSRSNSRAEPVSRPNSSQTSSQGRTSRHDAHEEKDSIHDLNGTLASLDLDPQSPWRPTVNPAERKTSC